MNNSALKKFLQIYDLFTYDPTVSKEFPSLTSPRLYLYIFFQIYDFHCDNKPIICCSFKTR